MKIKFWAHEYMTISYGLIIHPYKREAIKGQYSLGEGVVDLEEKWILWVTLRFGKRAYGITVCES